MKVAFALTILGVFGVIASALTIDTNKSFFRRGVCGEETAPCGTSEDMACQRGTRPVCKIIADEEEMKKEPDQFYQRC
ncbi:hypothetical protein HYFRA_00000054 [Hymenoscyphus fraxineus]|uniref:Uncharacterized protein n=1 Tax=Hymenoscyphus fraxineus TaxID=746836 RepID=A0A9N9L1G3_9HELO|nr:hypothetical protein HYFRA_00000054 [Hymenoscyphus fraxineus]